jgi:ribonuclease HI
MKYCKIDDVTPIKGDGLVLYCDGSARPNPGYIGAGIHGYVYNDEIPKKGTGLGTHAITKKGYIDNKDPHKEKPITILKYYNIAASFDFDASNNAAELIAIHIGIRLALSLDVKRLLIKTDSDYAIKVLTKFAAIWVRNGWVKSDGNPVNNQEFIKDLLVSVHEMEQRGITMELQWIKGHSTYLGNNQADKLAAIGSMMSKAKTIQVNLQEHPPEGYWKQDNTRHPFLMHRRMYFSTQPIDLPENVYFMGDHGKEDDFVGRPETDGALSIAVLKEPETVLDTIMNRCKELAGTANHFFFARLENIYTKGRQNDIALFKDASLLRSLESVKLNIKAPDDVELVRDLNPVRLSERVFDDLADMRERLYKYIDRLETDQYVLTDITEHFFTLSTKKVKGVEEPIYELQKKYVVGYKAEKLKVKHAKGESQIIATLGIDLPDRNTLKRLESYHPKIQVMTWMETPHCMRYCTIIETPEKEYSIWSGFYSNQIFLE